MRKHANIWLPLCLSLFSTQILASGFQVNAQSASGLGRAFAGDAVIADDATALARNPAAMSLFDQKTLSVGTIIANTNVHINNISYTDGATQSIGNTDNLAGVSPIPELFFIMPVSKSWHAGVGLYSNFGSSMDFGEDFVANDIGGKTNIKTLNLQLSTAYRINSMWRLGAGLDLIYGSGSIKRSAEKVTLLEIETSGVAVGGHAGVVFQPNATNRFGLSYRYSPKVGTTGDIAKVDSSFTLQKQTDDTLYLSLPNMIEFSGFHQVLPSYAVHYSVQYTTWSDFEKLTTAHFGTLQTYNYKNAFHLALGNTYQINSEWTLRGGYMYETKAIDQKEFLGTPDNDHHWLSMGTSYQFNSAHSVDLGLSYLISADHEVTELSTTQKSVTGTQSVSALLMGLQYNYRF
jgi:long-chain fatty acid transport protein